MDNMNLLQQIQAEIDTLPKGNITFKTIRGRRRMYLQWTENGKKNSVYVKAADEERIASKVARRKELEQQIRVNIYADTIIRSNSFTNGADVDYEMRVVKGGALFAMCRSVNNYGKRECFSQLERFIKSNSSGKVCLIYGLRRTGKTTLVLQAISQLSLQDTVYIKALSTDSMAMLNRDLKRLSDEGIKNVFIDEVTLIKDFIDSASLLSDVYAMMGMKIVLSGTDSLGLLLSTDDELYDRSFTIHTTFIPFREYA